METYESDPPHLRPFSQPFLNRLSRIQEHLGNTNMDHLRNTIIDHLDTPVIFTLHINYDLAGPSHRDQMSKIG